MFTLLADAMFRATLTKRNKHTINDPKPYADHYTPKTHRTADSRMRAFNLYRDLW